MKCIHCQIEINPLRLKALPGTKTCVECSTTGAKKGIIVTLGEKDHTCNEVMFLEDDQYERYLKSQKKARFDKIEEHDEGDSKKIDLNNIPDEE
jgi:hypothetical protein